jgi:hypothetical protein
MTLFRVWPREDDGEVDPATGLAPSDVIINGERQFIDEAGEAAVAVRAA